MVKNFFQKYRSDFYFFLIVLAILLLDQITKYFARIHSVQIDLIPGIFSLTFIQNTGAGFGLFSGQNTLLILISITIIAVVFYYYKKIPEKNKLPYFSAAFVLGGAFGNLIDRLIHGFVVDFIYFHFWPAFNFADLFITAGVFGLVIYFWKKK